MERWLRALAGVIAAAAVVAAATAAARALGANAVTAGFLFLVAVLALSTWQGLGAGVAGSLLATLAFNFFFLPPAGTLHIADPENWVALASFLAASTIASRLVASERRRAAEAESRRREVEALYGLSLELFTAAGAPAALDAAVARALRSLGAQSGGFVPATDSQAWVGSPADLETHRLLQRSAALGEQMEERVPVTIGERNVGTLVAYGVTAPHAALESVARLVGLAVERERLLAERARLEALQESDALKTTLLRAVSHDLATPLTAIGLQVDALGRMLHERPEGAAAVALLAAATQRLRRRIDSLLAMARLEAGSFALHREPSPPADLFRSAREHLSHIAPARRFETRVAATCPDADVDPSLAVEILVNLIENAHHASPPHEVIELEAAADPADARRVWLDVLDRGTGMALGDEAAPRRGLGLEIAHSFAAAHGGTVSLTQRARHGTRARLALPAASPGAEA